MTVTLVATRHNELGMCTSHSLCQILVELNPDVIFEEIPPSLHDLYYIGEVRTNLESAAISRYTQDYEAIQVPVDSDDVPPEEFFNAQKKFNRRIEGLTSEHGFHYRNITDRVKNNSFNHGFRYLNSIYIDNGYAEINKAIRGGLGEIGDVSLIQSYQEWLDVNDKREHHMLKTIYEYSQNNRFDQAVFTIGSAHRKAVIAKIEEYQRNYPDLVNWIFYTP